MVVNQKLSVKERGITEVFNARFVDVLNGSFFPSDTRIFIRNGKIISIAGDSESASDIDPDVSIDLKGMTVMPGLFNSHCHIQMINPTLFLDCKTRKAKKKYHQLQVDKNMEECLSRGITNIRDAYSEDLRPNRELVRRIDNGELAGPRIQQAVVVGPLGGYLSPDLKGINKRIVGLLGQGSIDYNDKNSGVVAFPPNASNEEIRRKVDFAIEERGADLIKVGESLEKSMINANPILLQMDQLTAITEQAKQRGLQSCIHSVSVDTFRRAVIAGFRSIAHVPRDGKLTDKDVEECLDAGCTVDPTLSVAYDMSWRLKGDPYNSDPSLEILYEYRNKVSRDLADEFWIQEFKELVKEGFNKANRSRYKMFGLLDLSKLLTHFSGLPAHGFENTRMLFDSGVVMACGNDGGIQSCTPAMVGNELELLCLALKDESRKVKFDNAEILRTVTINSAKSMGLEDMFGSIETGKFADLLIVEGNPFEDASKIGKPVDGLFMEGDLVIDRIGLQNSVGEKLK